MPDVTKKLNLDEWDEVKLFRDPVHQYIEVPKVYVHYLIDTYDMQRIKDVAQSGLRSVYNAATHDRFSHSLGVYHLGKKAFLSLKKNIINIIHHEKFVRKNAEEISLEKILKKDFEKELQKWEVLFHIACILHDIGHPAMSHTLEFLYDDIYMDIQEEGADSINKSITVSKAEYERFKTLRKQFISGEKKVAFHKCLSKKLLGKEGELKGNPHERMSAYYILSGVTIEKDSEHESYICEIGSLADNIVKLIESYNEKNGKKEKISIVKEIKDQDGTPQKRKILKPVMMEYLRFICRMITGETFDVNVEQENKISDNIKNSIKNTVIALLNGVIDADSLDYIARNSYSAGYDTNNVDVNRLCMAYSVRFQNNEFFPVFEKNALSVLEGFVNGRNFEPSWLYSHHKIVYNIDVLYKYLYKDAVEILYRDDLKEWEDIVTDDFSESIIEHIDKEVACSASAINDLGTKEKAQEIIEEIGKAYTDHPVLQKIIDYIASEDTEVAQTATLLLTMLRSDSVSEMNSMKKALDQLLQQLPTGHDLQSCKEKIETYRNNKKRAKYLANMLQGIFDEKDVDKEGGVLAEVREKTRRYLSGIISSDSNVRENVRKTVRENPDFYQFIEELSEKCSELSDIKNMYFSYILSPTRSFRNQKFVFYRSSDSDIDSLFKRLYFEIKDKPEEESLDIENDYRKLGKEYFERKYKSSLWKSYQEYKLFIEGIAEEIGMDFSTVNEYFLEIIEKGGKKVEFQSDRPDATNSSFDRQMVFERYKDNEIIDLNPIRNPFVKAFQGMFKSFKDVEPVIRIHNIKYKNFRNTVHIAFKEKVLPLGRIIDLTATKNKRFPYIFINLNKKENEEKNVQKKKYLEMLGEELGDYCVKMAQSRCITKREGNESDMENRQGKIIRDVVHGDIFIPQKFMLLVETSAFQRLRRIKQLSTADMVFPNAVHTRFAHCIGTFHIMTLIIDHFKTIFEQLRVTYQDEEVDALLVAALLHDIGHGPYSHTFERLSGNGKAHEEWSVDIIRGDLEIREALQEGFPEYSKRIDHFIEQIVSYIECKQEVNSGQETAEGVTKRLSFHTIFKSLISSQLDADRLDYLLRDSYNTGIEYGKVDVSAIIRGMQVTEYGDEFYVCISESVISYVEQFLFGRYKMYDSVYYNAYKVFSETLVLKIMKYISEKSMSDLDENITALLHNQLTLKKFLLLDDAYINGLFSRWQNGEDKILADMCQSLLQRKNYRRLYIMNQGAADLHTFKMELKKLFCKFFPTMKQDVDELNSFIFVDREFTAYKYTSAKEGSAGEYGLKIWILTNEGLLKDLTEVSPMFGTNEKSANWKTYKSFIYYNVQLLESELESMKGEDDFENNKRVLLEEIERLIKNSDLRQHIEIEEKYTCTRTELERIQNKLDEAGAGKDDLFREYEVSKVTKVDQIDTYYDTVDRKLAGCQCSFRCRSKSDGRYKITIKAPAPNSGFDKRSQVARFEYEEDINSENIEEADDFIRETLEGADSEFAAQLCGGGVKDVFVPQLVVKNNRSKYFISDPQSEDGFKFCVCLDRVIYALAGDATKKQEDYQIEVELESDYIHRVPMKFFTEKIESLLEKPIKNEENSKYIKGLGLLGLYP